MELDKSVVAGLLRALCQIKGDNVSVGVKMDLLYDLRQGPGLGEHIAEATKVKLVKILIEIVSKDWPKNGDFRGTKSSVDTLVKCKDRYSGGYPIQSSIRWEAICFLSDLSNFKEHVLQMKEHGLFHAMKMMLQSTLHDFPHGADTSSHRMDQKHIIAEQLVLICSNASNNPSVAHIVLEECLDVLLENFRPQQRESPDVHPLPIHILRFLYTTIGVATPQDKKYMVEQGIPALLEDSAYRREKTVDTILQALAPFHQDPVPAEDSSIAQRYKEKAALAFASGAYRDALKLYNKSIRVGGYVDMFPELLNNRSACELRLGLVDNAISSAKLSVLSDVRNPKSWARLAHALETKGHLEAAVIAFQEAHQAHRFSLEYATRLVQLEQRMGSDAPANWTQCTTQMDLYDHVQDCTHEHYRKVKKRMSSDPRYSIADVRKFCELSHAKEFLDDVPQTQDVWILSFTRTPVQDDSCGVYMYYITMMEESTNLMVCAESVLGTPTTDQLLRSILRSMAFQYIPDVERKRPSAIFIANRIAKSFHTLQQELAKYGITCILESRERAHQTAELHGTHPDGLN